MDKEILYDNFTVKDIQTASNSKGWHKLLKEIDVLIYTAVTQDDDALVSFSGKEGAGKSKLMQILGKYIQLRLREYGVLIDFGVSNIHFNHDDYIDASEEAEKLKQKGHINIFDEARRSLNRAGGNSKDAKKFTDFLSECRGSNQIHFIGLPAYHDLNSYVILWRQRLVVDVEKYFIEDEKSPVGYVLKRGDFRVYGNLDDIKNAYYHRVKYTYPKRCEYRGFFPNLVVIDEKAYRQKKIEARQKKFQENQTKESKKDLIVARLENGEQPSKIAKEFGVTSAYVYNIRRDVGVIIQQQQQ